MVYPYEGMNFSALEKSGIKITGLDISGSMLDHAKLKAQRENVEIPWFQSDCRKFDLKKKFALIFIVFNSMQHLHDRESLEEFFQCVHQHILSSGLFYS